MTQAHTIFHSLTGSWVLSRTIPHYGAMVGKAIFSPIPSEKQLLYYRESGIMTTEDTKTAYEFFKDYLYAHPTGSEIIIYFNETPKRVYHRLNLNQNAQCKADHQCNLDSYHGWYDFKNITLGRFQIVQQVKGPKKDYIITTQFSRSSL
jgi:hypothetical protein